MQKTIPRDEQIDTLLTKGVEQILPSVDFLRKKLEQGEILTVYCGFDPTAPTLHIGHTIQLRKLRQFQELGHKVIFLIGDFTARIGDPTDKTAARKQLTEREIKTNLRLYKKQAGKFIRFTGKNAATVKFNNRWLGSLKFADVLSLASHMTVDQMLKRDMFARRIEEEKPIYLHEFLYPLMQGYDSVAMKVDGEVGGNDQLFNMMAGRTLVQQIQGRDKFVLTVKLLTDANGKKMGKSEGNAVNLTDSSRDIYGKVMSWPDGFIIPAFELCTDYTMAQVAVIKQEFESGANPRDLKMQLGFEIVKSVCDEKAAADAQDAFVKTFRDKEIPTAVPEVSVTTAELLDVLLEQKIVSSKTEAKRLAEAGAITHLDTKEGISFEQLKSVPESGTYKIGKNRFIKIVRRG
jgi:tyrosyl-tRNA synthetase